MIQDDSFVQPSSVSNETFIRGIRVKYDLLNIFKQTRCANCEMQESSSRGVDYVLI